jgi:hypothetical protein
LLHICGDDVNCRAAQHNKSAHAMWRKHHLQSCMIAAMTSPAGNIQTGAFTQASESRLSRCKPGSSK